MLDDIGETLGDLGLAAQIQGGLNKAQAKPIKFPDPPTLDAKKSALNGSAVALYEDSPLTKYLMQHWAVTTGVDLGDAGATPSEPNVTNGDFVYRGAAPTDASWGALWPKFTETEQYTLLCKYKCAYDTTASGELSNSLFYDQERPLGRGAFGAVWLVFKRDSGVPMAAKRMRKTLAKQNKMLSDIKIEREVLSTINSRFTIGLYYAIQDDKDLQCVLQLAPGGDLEYMMNFITPKDKNEKALDYPGMSEDRLKFFIASMALGLDAIHKGGYVYRDLKPQNVLLDLDGQVRISDMGLAAVIKNGPIKGKSGTRGYWSPETIKKEKYTSEPDWWSLGVTAYVLFSHKMPFYSKESGLEGEEKDKAVDEASCSGEIDFKRDEPDNFKKLVTDLCTIDTASRLCCKDGASELEAHPYFAGFDWAALKAGQFQSPYVPNPNDINAPSKKEIPPFLDPEGVVWEDAEKSQFTKDSWDYINPKMWEGDEMITRINKFKELPGMGGVGGGGGGCCMIQ